MREGAGIGRGRRGREVRWKRDEKTERDVGGNERDEKGGQRGKR